mmetsp:Transcript_127582/g.367062  ORF Transcript_127582/g.367062 Transcript_127582/m.367062 type:complete len:273 (-) Transcript_127582:34-852(-)
MSNFAHSFAGKGGYIISIGSFPGSSPAKTAVTRCLDSISRATSTAGGSSAAAACASASSGRVMARRIAASIARSARTRSTSCSASSSRSGPSKSSMPSSISSSISPAFIISWRIAAIASCVSGTFTTEFIICMTSVEAFIASDKRIVAACACISLDTAVMFALAVYNRPFAFPERARDLASINMLFGSPFLAAIALRSRFTFSSSRSIWRIDRSTVRTSVRIRRCHSRRVSFALSFRPSSVLAAPKRLMPSGIPTATRPMQGRPPAPKWGAR